MIRITRPLIRTVIISLLVESALDIFVAFQVNNGLLHANTG